MNIPSIYLVSRKHKGRRPITQYKKTRCISIYENNVDNYTILQKDWTQWKIWTEPQNQQKIEHRKLARGVNWRAWTKMEAKQLQ